MQVADFEEKSHASETASEGQQPSFPAANSPFRKTGFKLSPDVLSDKTNGKLLMIASPGARSSQDKHASEVKPAPPGKLQYDAE